MMAEDHLSSKSPLLFSAAILKLANKVRRDGIVEFTKALAELFMAEQPLAAVARHNEVVAFFNQPSMAPLKPLSIANKYLSGYLTKSFGKRARRDILLHHYRCIADRAAPDFLQHVLSGSYVLWSDAADSGSHSITLTFSTHSDYEGDLTLLFLSGAQPLFEISFAIVPGSAIGSDTAELLFIGRVQGTKNKFAEIKQATRACHDVAPQHMLMIAIESIARALGIKAVAGVTNDEQLANLPNKDFRFDYNAFWENWDGRRTAGFYEIPIPLPLTALRDIRWIHRRRRRKKRVYKGEIALAIGVQLDPIFPRSRQITVSGERVSRGGGG
jgi:uncharacterized protein VirK/YbjX